jgi:hypothetical protein
MDGEGGRKQVGRMFNRACLFLSRMDEPPSSYMDQGQMDKESFLYSYAIANMLRFRSFFMPHGCRPNGG